MAVWARDPGGDGFVGRTEELAVIAGLPEAAAAGRPGVAWVEGEAGSGKTALVRRAVAELPAGFTLVRVLIASRPGSDDGWDRFRMDRDRCRQVAVSDFDVAGVGAALAAVAGVDLTHPPGTPAARPHPGPCAGHHRRRQPGLGLDSERTTRGAFGLDLSGHRRGPAAWGAGRLERMRQRLPQAGEEVPDHDVNLLVTRGTLGLYTGPHHLRNIYGKLGITSRKELRSIQL